MTTIMKPHLLYVYPWMPYPRRIMIYLREKRISSKLVTIVPVTDPQQGDVAAHGFPPRPTGSLPILAIPKSLVDAEPKSRQIRTTGEYLFLGQSLAIIDYLEALCDSGTWGFPKPTYSMRGGSDILDQARHNELLALANEALPTWNPVRLFGSALGPLKIPEAARESLRWTYRHLAAVERALAASPRAHDFDSLRDEQNGQPTIAEIILYQFLEFTDEVYGVDVTKGNTVDKATDVYGREVIVAYPTLRAFYQAFKTRPSAQLSLEDGTKPSKEIQKGGRTWWWDSGVEVS